MSSTNTALTFTSTLGLGGSLTLAGLYAGSSLMTVPLLYDLPTDTQVRFFSQFYYLGASYVVPLGLTSTALLATAAYFSETPAERTKYGIAAGLTLGTLAWTQLAMAGTINTLLKADKDVSVRKEMGAQKVIELLKDWRSKNIIRSGFALAGGILALATFAGAI